MESQKTPQSHTSHPPRVKAMEPGKMTLTFVDVQHEAIEVDSLFPSVFHMGVKNVHQHGFPCA